jgi:hypothetical protein
MVVASIYCGYKDFQCLCVIAMKRSIDNVTPQELRIDEICEVVIDIRKIGGTAKQRRLNAQKKYPEFEKRFPFLFDKACEDDFDMDRFTFMVNMKMKIDNKEVNLEDASVKVGQVMYDTYVAPNVDDK